MERDMMESNQKINGKQMENKLGNLTIRIDKELLNNYKLICEKNGFDMSKRLRLFIQSEIKFYQLYLNIIEHLKNQ